ncbi:MAG: helix-hairpin-helix domain-containing protein [Chloroflexota bacterium]
MGPNSTPPWRLIEPPTPTAASASTDAPNGGPAPATILDASLIRTLGLAFAAVALAIGAFVVAASSSSGAGVAVDAADGVAGTTGVTGLPAGTSDPGSAAEVVVEAAGAVARPGIFRLPAGSRVADLLAAAGGYGPRVDTGRVDREVNLAAALKDGDRVRIPSRDEPTPAAATDAGSGAGGGGAGGPSGGGGPLDLNRATASELDALPGVGPVTVDKIIAAREEAAFTSVDDLRTRGILGEKTFEKVRPLVAVP